MNPLAVSLDEAAKALSIGRTTLYKLIGNGRLKTVKLGSRRLVIASPLHELLQPTDDRDTD
ncbi:MAG: excisionase family DNA-binding protein [Pseudomonadota bacterium]